LLLHTQQWCVNYVNIAGTREEQFVSVSKILLRQILCTLFQLDLNNKYQTLIFINGSLCRSMLLYL